MVKESPLGKKTPYIETYSPHLLYPVPRTLAREKSNIQNPLPFTGVDIWNAYEISWLTPKGKPELAVARLLFPCTASNVVESKSLKLYLNSFNQTVCDSLKTVRDLIKKDLTQITQGPVEIDLRPYSKQALKDPIEFSGYCLDNLDVTIDTYQVDPDFLTTHSESASETVFSHLLKSNCLATGQPDWGSILIRYSGKKIDHEGLLKYIISFRNHSGFAEHCVEHMFYDILHRCRPHQLTVYAQYTRRGGIDINPFRSNFEPFK